jgi:hypothetical protein
LDDLFLTFNTSTAFSPTYARHGGRAVFLARFVTGLRVFGALVAGTSHPLVGAAFLAELLSELCYAELLRQSVGMIFTAGSSPSSRRLGRWFMLRLTVTGYGAAHILPGGGATAAAVTYSALRRKGYDPESWVWRWQQSRFSSTLP